MKLGQQIHIAYSKVIKTIKRNWVHFPFAILNDVLLVASQLFPEK